MTPTSKPLNRDALQVAAAPILGKMAGAVGNYNAHIAAYPDVDWAAVAADFVQRLGLEWNPLVTQARPALQHAVDVLVLCQHQMNTHICVCRCYCNTGTSNARHLSNVSAGGRPSASHHKQCSVQCP